MDLLTSWLFLSFVVERLTELAIKLVPALSSLDIKKLNIEMTISLIWSLIISFGATLDFFSMFNIAFKWPAVGMILTAILMSGGSNVVHDVVGWVQSKKDAAKANAPNN